ncbi:MAG: hypothetical protein OXM61_07645 [Candidatus Poribacteria bacterium]|nr:hypothetical protein [Candidatus Poribacteria bacterium]
MATYTSHLDGVEITNEAKELWKDAIDNGIRFKIKDTNIVLETDFDNMVIADQTYINVQKTKLMYEARIKDHNNEILKITLLRKRLEQLIEILDTHEIDETNRDLLSECASKLNKKLEI